MKGKRDLVKASITVNRKVWKDAKPILSDIGLSRSTFINVALTQLVREIEGVSGAQDREKDVVGSLFELSKRGKRKR